MIKVGLADMGRTIVMPGHELLEIQLPANPTTGYRWVEISLGDPQSLPLQSTSYHPTGAPGLVGSGGYQEWTFLAEQPGHNELLLRYQRPWDDSTISQTFALIVEVKA